MTKKIKILQGETKEKLIIDVDIISSVFPNYELKFVKGITWKYIFKILKTIDFDLQLPVYIPGKNITIIRC